MSMRKSGSMLRKSGLILLIVALTVLVMIGCGTEDPKPSVTRLYASSTCGVAPLRVDFRGDATGGASMPEPTGGNNWLLMHWDFGDGTVIDNGTSVAYHMYSMPDTYTVTLTVEDENGDRAQRSTDIVVQADSLQAQAYSLLDGMPATEVEACRPLQLGVFVEACGFDPIEDNYERFVFLWTVGDVNYTGTHPQHSFSSDDLGEQEITVVLEDPTRSITRFDTLTVNVTPSAGADVSISTDWAKSPQGTASDVLDRDIASWPDTLTYTVHLRNDGPGDAYSLTVAGTLDFSNRILFYDSDYTVGDFVYVAFEGNNTVKEWIWNVPELASGAEVSIDILFYVEIANAGAVRTFPTSLEAYPCDTDGDDLSATATLNVLTVPPPP